MAVSGKKTSRYISAFDAVARGDLKELMRIIPVMVNLKYNEKCPVEDSPFYRCSLLHAAAVHGSPEIVTYLISRGLRASLKNGMGQTPMHCAISMRKKNICEILQILLAAPGAGVNARDFDGDSLLHYAVCKDIKIVEFLVKNRARTDVKNFWGETPLHTAAEKGDIPTMKYLLSHRAVIDERDSSGGTALKSAICGRDPEKAVRFLLEAGTDPNIQDADGNTPLHTAAAAGENSAVKYLIKAGADRSLKNNTGLIAAELCSGELSKQLIPAKNEKKRLAGIPAHTVKKAAEHPHAECDKTHRKKRILPAAMSGR